MRRLTLNEIETLCASGCRATDWTALAVADGFDATKLFNCSFRGYVKLGKCEIDNSTLRDCSVGSDCRVSHVRLLQGYNIGDGCELHNLGELSAPATNYRPQVAAMNENGGRTISLFRGMTVGDAYLWAKFRGNHELTAKLQYLSEKESEQKPIGYIGERCTIKNCLCIRNVAVENGCVIENCTSVEDGIIGRGCHVRNGVIAQRFLLGENVTLENGLRLIDSVVGDNSTLACCEVVSSMIFPAHEQHHNNSFLIAATVKGQSNIAAGATIGSNHNSRTADGEIVAGRGFWPGLCSSFKHSSKFASYCILAKGDYQYELNIALPFALVNNNMAKNQLEVMPAYWWMYNMYALRRNAVKYRQRDNRTAKRQHIEFDMFAPDTAEEIIAARKLIKLWTEEAYNPNLAGSGQQAADSGRCIEIVAQGMENSKRKVLLLKAGEAYKAYGDMLVYYAMSLLTSGNNRERPQYNALSYEREKKWHNIGGQLVGESDLNRLFSSLKVFSSWDDVHKMMDCFWSDYPEQKKLHAYQTLLDLYLCDKIDEELWQALLERYDKICEEIESQAVKTRQKDFSNPFRQATFDSDDEMHEVLK